MLTQFFRSINWVDVLLSVFFIRTVFISVKSGFVAEGFKFIGTLTALFISLHFYSYLAALLAKKTSAGQGWIEFFIFVTLWIAITILFMLLHQGVLRLFKIEATHQGVDKYAAGFLGAARGIFLCSLMLFAVLLMQNDFIKRQAFTSFGYKLVAKAAPNTYSFGYNNVISKLFSGQRFNADVFAVISGSGHGTNPKRNN